MARIQLQDSVMDMVSKMSDGNPGAIEALMALLTEAEAIDPESAFKQFGPILNLDTLEIYGTDIYILWNDKFDRDVRKMCMMLRAVQLGIFPQARLKEMASDQMRSINISDEELNEIDKKVCGQLTQFRKAS